MTGTGRRDGDESDGPGGDASRGEAGRAVRRDDGSGPALDRGPGLRTDGGEPRADDPAESRAGDRGDDVPAPTENPVLWYLRSRHPLVISSRDILSSVVLVFMIGLTLFAISGVWPPMVAVESGSMEPHMSQGDLVIVVEEDRFTSQLADEWGVVTADRAADSEHERFGAPGSVIVYRPHDAQGRLKQQTPIIHRTAFYVEEGEDWVDRADPEFLGPRVDECSEVPRDNCPAPYDGYVTRGDANPRYDQASTQSTVVRPQWVEGRAAARIPYLGCIRLAMSDAPGCFEDDRRR